MIDGSAPAGADGKTAEELAQLLGRLRRTIRRRIRRDWPDRPLPESELELLRLVEATPGLRVQDAASALGVAPNTVSTLVGRLTAAGLLERRVDPEDTRAARLSITVRTRRRFARWRDRRSRIMEDAMRSLSADDRRALTDALPALERLVDRLEADR